MPRIPKSCAIHFDIKDKRCKLIQATKTSWQRILEFKESWRVLSWVECQQKVVAENLKPSDCEIWYHRECYQRFTDKGKLSREIKKQEDRERQEEKEQVCN